MEIIKTAVFKVKPDSLNRAQEAIRRFVKAVDENEPETLLYLSLQAAKDETSFIHFMRFASEDAEEFHKSTEWVVKFARTIYPLCVEEPRFHLYRAVACASPKEGQV
ncbi:MAG: antibiotic biosynthesis monooxygenase [Elusimicrobia bacterium]|nr:antibiotic biosynthesis monooxygenase [Elusimicrobiota bacterium]